MRISPAQNTRMAAPMTMAAPTMRDERVTVMVATTGEVGFELAVLERVTETMDDSGMEAVVVDITVEYR